jgi:hypothetical protein
MHLSSQRGLFQMLVRRSDQHLLHQQPRYPRRHRHLLPLSGLFSRSDCVLLHYQPLPKLKPSLHHLRTRYDMKLSVHPHRHNTNRYNHSSLNCSHYRPLYLSVLVSFLGLCGPSLFPGTHPIMLLFSHTCLRRLVQPPSHLLSPRRSDRLSPFVRRSIVTSTCSRNC